MPRVATVCLVAGCFAIGLWSAVAAAGTDKGEKFEKVDRASWSAVRAPTAGAAQAIGGYAKGCVAGAVALPPEGPGYQVIRLQRSRYYGHPVLIQFLRDFGRRMEQAHLGTALVGDMSQPRGGPMSFGHASHQIGLDADIWLRLDLPSLPREKRENLQEVRMTTGSVVRVNPEVFTTRQMEMIRLAASDPRVSRIFVNPAIKLALCQRTWADRSWLRLIRPWWGHDAHFHIRLHCPADSPDCEEQKALPAGDGCEDDLLSWLPKAYPLESKPIPASARPAKALLPVACRKVLSTSSKAK